MSSTNMLVATVQIEGVRPLLWHVFNEYSIPLEKKERTGVPGNDPEEWKLTFLMTPERQLFFPPSYPFSSLRNGAYHTKRGRQNLQKNLSATLQIMDEMVLVDRFVPEDISNDYFKKIHLPVYIDVSSVVNKVTKGRNVRYRISCSPGWHMTFSIMWDKTIVSRGEMEAIVIDTGMLVGIADARQIGAGRFMLQKFEVEERPTSLVSGASGSVAAR